MSLNYQLTDIHDWQNVCYRGPENNRRLHGTTECLIFATMVVDIGTITEKNYHKFWLRLRVVQGALAQDGWGLGQPYSHITLADVRRHIGLHCNVTDVGRASWFKRRFDLELMSIRYREREELRKLADQEPPAKEPTNAN